MSADFSAPGAAVALGNRIGLSRAFSLRGFIVIAGVAAAALFAVVGVGCGLQLYGDGSIFSYAIAVGDAWAFHWHNISSRLTVYLFCHVPAELYVKLTGDARGGIGLYGFLFFGSQLFGLALTFAADRSQGRAIFTGACLSTAVLCPLVFGYPTEMWVSHALFWPALAICHSARSGISGGAAVTAVLTPLVLTHEAGVVFASTAVATLVLRGSKDEGLRRSALGFLIAMSVWAVVRLTLPPDDYFASFLVDLALNAVDLTSLASNLLMLIGGALVIYGLAFLAFSRFVPAQAHVLGALAAALLLGIHWMWFDRMLHADERYYLRTALLVATPLIGLIVAWHTVEADKQLPLRLPPLLHLKALLRHEAAARLAAGALAMVMLIHVVETAKFVAAWSDYKVAVRTFAMGTASDDALGDPRFVSSNRIDGALDRLAWLSTTQFLSVLVAPQFAPQRIVVDPRAGYFWISCRTATRNEEAARAVPAESRRLIRVHACLHR